MISGQPRGQRFDAAWLEQRLRALGALGGSRCSVAWSGGADSTALLAALAGLRDAAHQAGQPFPALRALHVDHHLQPAAVLFRRHCRLQARQLRVPLKVLDVQVDLRGGRSPEEAARAARYAALAGVLRAGEVLLTAQHAGDQLESVLLQLLRGGGAAGLAGMPEACDFGPGRLLRPLLALPATALRAWLRARQLTWVDDPSNGDLRHDRNYLRAEVVPRLLARWPAAARTVARSARHAAAADHVLRRDGAAAAALAADGPDLDLRVLRCLSPLRQRLALRSWIAAHELPLPDERVLGEVQGLLALRGDAQPRVHWAAGAGAGGAAGAEVLRHGDRLQLRAVGASGSARPAPGQAVQVPWRWRGALSLALPGGGVLRLRRDRWGDVNTARLPPQLLVRLRGDAVPLPSGCDVKSLLREAGIPAYLRSQVPLVCAGDRLLAVADLWCDQSIRAQAPGAGRARFVWQQE